MESFLDPKVEQLLAKKSDTERLQAIAFSIACLCTGPTPFQPVDYYHIPRSKGKNIIEVIYTVFVTVCEISTCDTCLELSSFRAYLEFLLSDFTVHFYRVILIPIYSHIERDKRYIFFAISH